MRTSTCDRCSAPIHQFHLLNNDAGGVFQVSNLRWGLSLKMPILTQMGYMWQDVDYCGDCAKELLEGFGKKAQESEATPGTHPESPRKSPACLVVPDLQSALTTVHPMKTHVCPEGAGRKGWYDSHPSDIKIDTNVDGTWRCHGLTGDWGVAIGYCPFCGWKLGEHAPASELASPAQDPGWSQGLHTMIPLLLGGHRRFLVRDPGTRPSAATPVKIITPSSVILENAAREGLPQPWLSACFVVGDGHAFPQRSLLDLKNAFWVLNHEGKR